MKRVSVLIIMTALLVSSSVFAGGDKTGEAGFMFLKIPVGAREVALGGTGLTSTTGAGAIFWNPANISAQDRPSVTFSNLNHFAGISSNYFAFAVPLEEIGTLSAGLTYVSWGSIHMTTEERPDGTGSTFSPYELALSTAFSRQVTDRVSAGMAVKFVYSQIDQVSANGVAFDFGFTYNTGMRGLKFAFVANNLGTKARYDGEGLIQEVDISSSRRAFLRYSSEPFEMPASVGLGASMDAFRNEQNAVTVFADQNINNFSANRTNFGLEYGFRQMFFLRGGYTSTFSKNVDYSVGSSSGAGLAFGGGINYKFTETIGINVDYGYFNQGILDATHRFSVGLTF